MKITLAKCGCDCGKCPAYKENSRTVKDRRYCSEGWAKYIGARLKPELCYCEGCQAADPWKSGHLLPARGCILRACVLKMGIENCAYCPFYPCEELKVAIPGENFGELVAKRIGATIPKVDYHAFIEPYEGLKNLAELRVSLRKEDIVKKPKVKPFITKIIEFPSDLSLAEPEIRNFKSIHKLLTNIISASADTYAKQSLIKKRRQHMLNLFLLFGIYGELKDSNLVIDSKTIGSRPEFDNIFRKHDNKLHGAIQQSVRILKKFGVQVKHISVKKEWLLKLSFKKSAGGVMALNALKAYVTKLVKKYGKPKYLGASRYRGKAFILFATADMKILKG